jgi:enolase
MMKHPEIASIHAREIYDSRGFPTVEVNVVLEDGSRGRGISPAGASTGRFEACELRDNDKRFCGKGVKKAVSNIRNIIASQITGMDASDQAMIDKKMINVDGTENKSRLGANAILACSMAVCHAAATSFGVPLYRYLGGTSATCIPVPMVQIFGGGAHANGSIDIQDFLVIPASASSFAEGYAMVTETYHAAKAIFKKRNKPIAIADEGGLWPSGFTANEEGLSLLTNAIESAGLKPGHDLYIAIDVASSEFYDENSKTYYLSLENKRMNSEEFVEMLCKWVGDYPIISIEDGTSELDWHGARLLTERLKDRIQIIGDDLFTTNISRISKGIEMGACNAVLIKMNQIGTITETLEAVSFASKHGYLPVISARSGETEDTTIVHLAVATNAGQLKVGSAVRGERTVKWNEVIRIEEDLGLSGTYLSLDVFKSAGIKI